LNGRKLRRDVVMMTLTPTRRLSLAVLVCAVVGVVAGVIYGVVSSDNSRHGVSLARDDTPLNPDAGSAYRIATEGSPEVSFPAGLSDLGGQPAGLAFDRDGVLWYIATNESGRLVLGKISSQGIVDRLVLPGEGGGLARLGMIDGQSPVIATGQQILIVDPKSVDYRVLKLPDVADSAALASDIAPSAAGRVTDLKIDGRIAYVSRFGMNSITRVDLDSGEALEIVVDPAFGGFDNFVIEKGNIWLLKTGDTPGGPPSQLGVIRNGQSRVDIVSQRVRSAVATGDGITAIGWNPDGVFRVGSDGQSENVQVEPLASFFSRLGPEARIVEASAGQFWITDVTSNSVAWLNTTSGETKLFELPTWSIDQSRFNCPYGVDCSGVEVGGAHLDSAAVAPNGDLYVADDTFNRIGVITLN
jgi:streptogramin lyase